MRIREIWRLRDFEIDYKFPDEKSRWLFSSRVSLMLVFDAGALALFEKEQHKFIILAVRHLSQGTSIPNKYKRKVIKTVCFFDEAIFDSMMAIGVLLIFFHYFDSNLLAVVTKPCWGNNAAPRGSVD